MAKEASSLEVAKTGVTISKIQNKKKKDLKSVPKKVQNC